MKRASLFIRNDDVWTLDREFRYFFDSAIDHGIPVVHAVIPGKMDQGLIRFLCRAKKKNPQLLDIVQHGWIHENHSANADTKYEFGPSRGYRLQNKDINQGLKKMRSSFGKYFTRAFVPPFHGYDERTLRVLDQEGFQIFSAGNQGAGVKKRFINMPSTVSFSCYEGGRSRIRRAKDVITMLARSINHRALSGVLTHHADFKRIPGRKELTRFFGYIAALTSKDRWRVMLFSEFLSRGNAHGH